MIGQSLGRYTLESKLGEGGMGVVFKARDTQLERTVAIKILPADKIADPDRKRRFVQEAKAASALNHPNIVTIHDISADGDTDFIVMEYLAGTTLDHGIPVNGLPIRQALKFGTRIADALAKAHEAGIVHRDLKPSNVMVTPSGDVKVLDFGVAKLLEPTDDSAPTRTVALTDEGTTIGTPAYMSPEQAEGRKVDGRSDIFSFGSVLYEMVTGRKAFSGESRLSVLAKILNEEPTPPSRVSALVPLEVEKTILRCLRKDPARRYQTMADLKVALEDLATETGATAPAQPRAQSYSSSTRWALAAAAAVVVATVGYFVSQSWRTVPAEVPLRAVPLTSLSGVVRSPSFSPDGNYVAFVWNGPKRDNPDIYIQQIGAGEPHRLTSDPANDYSPSWSPDGRAIAFLRRTGSASDLRLIAPLGGAERKLADIRLHVPEYRSRFLTWCPDSSCVVVTDGSPNGQTDALFAVSVLTGEKRQLTNPPTTATGEWAAVDVDPAISPDGRWLIFRRDTTPFTGWPYRVPLTRGADGIEAQGQPVRLPADDLAGNPVWTPDSREILYASRGSLWRLGAINGGAPTRMPFVGEDGLSPTVIRTADGRQRLVYVRSFSDRNIWRIDVTAPGVPAEGPPVSAIATTRAEDIPNLSPDGQRIIFLSNRSDDYEFWMAAPDGSGATQLTTLARVPGFGRWSPDGNTIAFHSDPQGRPDVMLLSVRGGVPRTLTTKTTGGGYPNFSRDGQWVYYSTFVKGLSSIWKIPVSGGEGVQVTNTPGTISIESTDGRDLYYADAAERTSGLWRFPLSGGSPVKIADNIVLGNFDVIEKGLYYVDRSPGESGAFFTEAAGGEARLQFYDFATRRATTIARNLGTVRPGLTVSRDGRTIFFARVDSAVDELMLVENFR